MHKISINLTRPDNKYYNKANSKKHFLSLQTAIMPYNKTALKKMKKDDLVQLVLDIQEVGAVVRSVLTEPMATTAVLTSSTEEQLKEQIQELKDRNDELEDAYCAEIEELKEELDQYQSAAATLEYKGKEEEEEEVHEYEVRNADGKTKYLGRDIEEAKKYNFEGMKIFIYDVEDGEANRAYWKVVDNL